jgi:hypothetical protein
MLWVADVLSAAYQNHVHINADIPYTQQIEERNGTMTNNYQIFFADVII